MLQGVSIYLIGMMGAGKTTTAEKLSRELNYRFLDTDSLIEQVTGLSVTDIFTQQGEAAFREIETKVLAEISSYTRNVVSTGGGIVLKQINWSYLHHGLVIWLDAPVEVLLTRLMSDQDRPLLQVNEPASTLQSILEERLPLYQQADLRIKQTPEQTPQENVEEIIKLIPSVLKPQLTPNLEIPPNPLIKQAKAGGSNTWARGF